LKSTSNIYPFTAIVGQEKMKKALILNAINNRLGGILIRGEKGTAKTTAVRALAELLPEIPVADGCPYSCDPENEKEMCASCREKKNAGTIKASMRKKQVIDLPLGATEDRVIGTIDIEHAIKKGEKSFEPGLLAGVNRGILYVDEINLLDDHLVDVLLDSAAMGVNYIEREGVSFSHPARFILIGTMNPEEGELRPQLLDRFGLCVDVEGITDPENRVLVIERRMGYEADPESFREQCAKDQDEMSSVIINARKLLPEVVCDRKMYELIVSISLEMGVDGHRADLYMLKTAQTIAAYHQKKEVTEEDIREAAELVLNHRMRRMPFQGPEPEMDKIDEAIDNHKKKTMI